MPNKVLLDAAATIRKGWTQGCYARDTSGRQVGYKNPRAVCWCAMGAIEMASLSFADLVAAMSILQTRIGTGIPSWDDAPRQNAENIARIMELAAHDDTN